MFGIQHYVSFVTAILIFQLLPGPGTLAILGATARDGARCGLGAVLGTLLGDFLFMLAAVLGLAAVLAACPLAFSAMRWFGLGYLIWIGVHLLLSAATGQGATGTTHLGGWAHIRRAFAVSLTNPKVIMFFMGFFPLFLQADAHPVTLVVMMAHVTLLSFLYQAMLVLAGNVAAKRLSRFPLVRRVGNWIAGLALIGFGLRLALDRQ